MMTGGPAPADPAAFVDWVRPHLTSMTRLAARLAPDGDRDDIVQEALASAWAKRDQFDPARGRASAWLLAIVANHARKAGRRSRSRLSLGYGQTQESPPDDDLDVRQALRALSRRQRLAVDCFYFAGLSIAETAAVLGCAEGTVKSTLADARAKLRPLLEVSE